jgi:dTMP kinase
VTATDSPGFFITLEGPEGGGKSTQSALLAERLRAVGVDAVRCAEPGGGPIPQAIRAVLLNPSHAEMTAHAELLLFLAARAQHVEETIRPALAAGRVVVCDRFSDSTIAYQGHAGGLPLDEVTSLIEFAAGGLWPDLTLLLDLPAEVGLTRQRERNRMEEKGMAYHQRVRDGFLAQAARHPDRIQVIDASMEIETVTEQIWLAVEGALARRQQQLSGSKHADD